MNAEPLKPHYQQITIAPQEFNVKQAKADFGRMEKQRAIEKEMADEKRRKELERLNRPKPPPKHNMPQPKVPLYDALQIGYLRDPEEQQKRLRQFGFVLDDEHTNYDHMTAYNPHDSTLLYVVNGTHPFRPPDYITDLDVAFGFLKNSKRFRSDKREYKKVRKYFEPKHIRIAGHSLGGAIASELETPPENIEINKKIDIHKKDFRDPYDRRITTFNAASDLWDKKKEYNNPIEKSYRHHHDLVSFFKKNTIPIDKHKHPDLYEPNNFTFLYDQFNSHALENLKVADDRKNIFI